MIVALTPTARVRARVRDCRYGGWGDKAERGGGGGDEAEGRGYARGWLAASTAPNWRYEV
eukprot:COSAG01_NODE_26419_length_714_cov_2.957724_1_plen_60_part_00